MKRVLLYIVPILIGLSQASAQYPDRHIDGEALANYLTPWLLQQGYSQSTLLYDPYVSAKLPIILMSGRSFRPDRNDKNRQRLLNWILKRDYHSIMPDQLLKAAIRIEEGRVLDGLTLAWDVLREGWENSMDRNLYDHSLRLFDITGELDVFEGNVLTIAESNRHAQKLRSSPGLLIRQQAGAGRENLHTIRGDNFSAWYHFIGTALHSFLSTNSRFEILPGWWKTRFMIFLEEKILFDQFIDPQKRVEIDKEGVAFGRQLARNLKKFRTLEEFKRHPRSKKTKYIYDAPDKYGSWWHLLPGQSPKDFGTTLRLQHKKPLMATLKRVEELKLSPRTSDLVEIVQMLLIADSELIQKKVIDLLLKFNSEQVLETVLNEIKYKTYKLEPLKAYVDSVPFDDSEPPSIFLEIDDFLKESLNKAVSQDVKKLIVGIRNSLAFKRRSTHKSCKALFVAT